MTRRWPYRVQLLAVGGFALAVSAVTALPATAATVTCGTVTIAKLNTALDIDAAHVTSVHPAKDAKTLICSYYGNSGRAANEATINYIPTTATSFAALKASNARSHKVRTVTGISASAYSYVIGTERYLYGLDGRDQVQMFAIAPLARLEALARALPALS